jgi:hypothetical protein
VDEITERNSSARSAAKCPIFVIFVIFESFAIFAPSRNAQSCVVRPSGRRSCNAGDVTNHQRLGVRVAEAAQVER